MGSPERTGGLDTSLPGKEGRSHRGARGGLAGHAGALRGGDAAAGRRLVCIVAIQRALLGLSRPGSVISWEI